MNISEFTETKIEYSVDGIDKLCHIKTNVAEALNAIINNTQAGSDIKIKTVSIIKRKGNRTHELFI